MGRFHPVYGPGIHGHAHACDRCGGIVYTEEEMYNHRCPGSELEISLPEELAYELEPRPEFPWLRMFALLLLLLLLGMILCAIK